MPARLTEIIPEYLQPYIVRQNPSLYTPMDHASWRFALKIARAYFSKHAHQKYLDGLKETGISTERIPLIEEMDQCLRKFGWRAVAVSGFIPPGVFMEFQSLGILPIACDMRTLEHLAYTPAPDIVHEAAGHAPIISDPEFAAYLRSYGELSRKSIFSSQDMDVYNAILNLSDTKENPASTPAQIEAAQKGLDEAIASVTYVSEATILSRMGWWTFEYGLIGSIDDPKIYGAGLLSSVGESYHCLSPEVRKIPFSIECIHTTYDITRPQPQLFVARDFQQLVDALEELAQAMAFRRGGMESLEKAIQAKTVTTTVLDTGLQISGILVEAVKGPQGEPIYLKFQGPTQLAHADRELDGQGAAYHTQGFSTPLGKIVGIGETPASLTDEELSAMGLVAGGTSGRLEFESGVIVEGKLKQVVRKSGAALSLALIIAFDDCTVRRGQEILFRPEWGTFDMACGGSQIASVFGGAADRRQYLADTGGYRQEPRHPKTNLTDANRELNTLYAKVREIREKKEASRRIRDLYEIHSALEKKYPEDWLLRYELLELLVTERLRAPWESALRENLSKIARKSLELDEMISRGMALL